MCIILCVGMTVEGIYRRTGQNAVITQLLNQFNNGRLIQTVCVGTYTINNIANKLQFIHTLIAPLSRASTVSATNHHHDGHNSAGHKT